MIPAELVLEDFAKDLATQASQAFPPDLPEQVKRIVTQVVYEFIKIAGDALNKEQHEYDVNESVLICQLFGEWMYHKGIDNFKNQIPQEYWRPILQQIAFAIFETLFASAFRFSASAFSFACFSDLIIFSSKSISKSATVNLSKVFAVPFALIKCFVLSSFNPVQFLIFPNLPSISA